MTLKKCQYSGGIRENHISERMSEKTTKKKWVCKRENE